MPGSFISSVSFFLTSYNTSSSPLFFNLSFSSLSSHRCHLFYAQSTTSFSPSHNFPLFSIFLSFFSFLYHSVHLFYSSAAALPIVILSSSLSPKVFSLQLIPISHLPKFPPSLFYSVSLSTLPSILPSLPPLDKVTPAVKGCSPPLYHGVKKPS